MYGNRAKNAIDQDSLKYNSGNITYRHVIAREGKEHYVDRLKQSGSAIGLRHYLMALLSFGLVLIHNIPKGFT